MRNGNAILVKSLVYEYVILRRLAILTSDPEALQSLLTETHFLPLSCCKFLSSHYLLLPPINVTKKGVLQPLHEYTYIPV